MYVLACPGCNQRNYFDEWYDGDDGAEDCNLSVPISVFADQVTPDVDFDLPEGPRYLHWWDVRTVNGELDLGFDLMPGFNAFLTSAVVSGPDGFIYTFDLEADVYRRTNDCQRIDAWLATIESGFDEGEYSLTLRFRNGVEKTYTHTLVTASPVAVDPGTVGYTVNEDGSIQVTWTNPVAGGQLYRVRIYRPDGEPVFKSGATTGTSITIPESSLRCMVIGGIHQLQVRSVVDGLEDQAVAHGGTQDLTYLPSSDGEFNFNRVRWTSVQDFRGDLNAAFDVRYGSRDTIADASVTLLGGTFNEAFDLADDWFDLSTESGLIKGWSMDFAPPFAFGTYQFDFLFADGRSESRTFELQSAAVIAVDTASMHYEIFENGAMEFYWAIPSGGEGQQYEIRVRSADGSKEYFRSSRNDNMTDAYASSYDLRALPHGETFKWFVRAYDPDRYTMRQSDPLTFVYDPFNMFPKADIDKDWDVDGVDLAVFSQRIQGGLISDVAGDITKFALSYGRLK